MGDYIRNKERSGQLEGLSEKFKNVIDFYRMEYSEDLMVLFDEFGYLLICHLIGEGRLWSKPVWERSINYSFPSEKLSEWSPGTIENYLDLMEKSAMQNCRADYDRTLSRLREWDQEFRIRKPSVLRQILQMVHEVLKLSQNELENGKLYDVMRQILDLCGNGRADRSSYILPDILVERLLGLLYPEEEKRERKQVLDPKCGSGAMLFAVWNYLKDARCLGFENDRNLWIAAQILGSLLWAEPDRQEDAFDSGIPEIREEAFIKKRFERVAAFDLVIANPPFGNRNRQEFSEYIRVDDLQIRGEYNRILVQSLQVLKEQGLAVLVVPDSFLFATNGENVKVRRWLLEHCQVEGVINLPEKTFSPGARVRSSVLLLQKGTLKNPYILFYQLKAEAGEEDKEKEWQSLQRTWKLRGSFYEEWKQKLKEGVLENAQGVLTPENWEHKEFWFACPDDVVKRSAAVLLPRHYQPAEHVELHFENPEKLLDNLIWEQEALLKDMQELLKEVRNL